MLHSCGNKPEGLSKEKASAAHGVASIQPKSKVEETPVTKKTVLVDTAQKGNAPTPVAKSLSSPEVTAQPNAPKPNTPKKTAKRKKPVTYKKRKRAKRKKPVQTSKAIPILQLEEKVFYFDTVKAGAVVQHRFFFSNMGQAPLTFKNGHATCGCTTPIFPKEPIKPGQASYIYISFNTREKSGNQDAKVYFESNASDKEMVLHLKGYVKEK